MSRYENTQGNWDDRCQWPKGKWETKISRMSIGQLVISIGLVIATLVVGADWSWVDRFSFEGSSHLTPGSQEFEAKRVEYFRLKKTLASVVEKEPMSVKDLVLTIRRGNEAASELGFGYIDGVEIHKIAKEKFVKNWRPKNGQALDEITLRQAACQDYEDQAREVSNDDGKKGQIAEAYGDDCFVRALWWLARTGFKWYWLMTIPILLIVLIDLKYGDKKLSEELILRPRVFLKACCLGPIGFLLMDNSAGKAYRYNKLAKEYLAQKPSGYELNEQEHQAILRQVEQPMLAFEEALGAFVSTGQLIRQPVTVCFMIWLAGLVGLLLSLHCRMNSIIAPQVQVAVAYQETPSTPVEPEITASKVVMAKKVPTIITVVTLALIADKAEQAEPEESVRVIPRKIVQPTQQCCWNPDKPRGPPEIASSETAHKRNACPSGLATVTEG